MVEMRERGFHLLVHLQHLVLGRGAVGAFLEWGAFLVGQAVGRDVRRGEGHGALQGIGPGVERGCAEHQV